MATEDTIQPAFYSVWPNFGKKFSQQLGEIRVDTSSLTPIARAVGFDAAGDWSDLDGIAANSVQAYEIGQDGFHNKFRTHYNKDDDLFEIAYNTNTEEVPNWYTTWTIDNDGQVTQQNTPTTASNVGAGSGWFKQKVGVDLEFKTITATAPITLTAGANSIDVDGSDLVTNYSSLGGDESLITAKSSFNLPFKGLSAGPNVVLTASGTAIQIESTAQVVEFYGIHVGHDDGSQGYPEVHNFLVNREQFYITQQTTSPSNKTIILNRIGNIFNSNEYVAVAGDEMTGALEMYDGSAAAPAVTFTADNTMGLYRNAANDLGVSIAGAAHSRFLSDRLLTKQLQITPTGNAAAPDLYFFPDSDTGIFQQGLDSIAFTTGGVRAGWFSPNQDFYVTGRVFAGDGSVENPSYTFGSDQDTGIYSTGLKTVDIASDGARVYAINTTQAVPLVPLRSWQGGSPIPGGTKTSPDYSWIHDTDTGMFQSALGKIEFSCNDTLVGWFVDTDLHVTNDVYADGLWAVEDVTAGRVEAGIGVFYTSLHTDVVQLTRTGSASEPAIYFGSDRDTGLFGTALDNYISLAAGGWTNWTAYKTYFGMSRELRLKANSTAASPALTFNEGDKNTGLYNVNTTGALAGKDIGFATDGAYAGHFDSDQNLNVQNDIKSSRVHSGLGTFYLGATVNDEAYSEGDWDGSLEVATKNALRDQFEYVTAQIGTFYGITFRESEAGGAVYQTDALTVASSTFYLSTGGDGKPLLSSTKTFDALTVTGLVSQVIETSNVTYGAGAGDAISNGATFNTCVGINAGGAITTADNNTLIGNEAGAALVGTGNENTFIGSGAGALQTTGDYQVAVGFEAGKANNTSGNATCVGYKAGMVNIGRGNAFIGSSAGRANEGGEYNTFIGASAGALQTSGNYQVAVGFQAGKANSTGSGAVCVGYQAGLVNTGGSNVFIGFQAGQSMTTNTAGTFLGYQAGETATGGNNTFIGYQAGLAITTTTKNTFIGDQAGYQTAAGAGNVFIGAGVAPILTNPGDGNVLIGMDAADIMVAGAANTIIGRSAGAGLGTGDGNTLVGTFAFSGTGDFDNATAFGANAGRYAFGSSCTFIGADAGKGTDGNSSGTSNTFVGNSAGTANEEGAYNTFIGVNAGALQTSGNYQVAVGYQAGRADNVNGRAVCVGYQAGFANTGQTNTFIGYRSGLSMTTNTGGTFLGYRAGETATGGANTFIGYQAGLSMTTNTGGTFLGYRAGENATGANNTLIGTGTGLDIVAGAKNTFVGQGAGHEMVSGQKNTIVGYNAGYNMTGESNSAFGTSAGNAAGNTGNNGVYFGYQAGQGNVGGTNNLYFGYNAGKNTTEGDDNIMIGVQAGYTNVTGSRGFFLGRDAGYKVTGDDNMCIGYAAGYVLAAVTNNTMIGNYTGVACTGSGNVYLGFSAGRYQVAEEGKFIIDNQDRTDAPTELSDALIVGDFYATASSQTLKFNAQTTITNSFMGTPDAITATAGGVAASILTVNTEVTTDGDGEDNVTLRNGANGQIKHIYCVVVGHVDDTWKITPATMVGGTQITFAGVGEGCTLVYADNEGWVVTGNNGGDIT